MQKLSNVQTEGQTTQAIEAPEYYEQQEETSMLARRVGTKNAGATAQAENASIDDGDLDGEPDTSDVQNAAQPTENDEAPADDKPTSEDRFAAISAQFEQAAEDAKDDLVEQFGEDAVGEEESNS